MTVKPIQPKSFKTNVMRKAVDNALLACVPDAQAMFYQTYANWDNKPKFEVIGPRTKNGTREVIYQTESTPYVWVANGTDGPYDITPKNAKALKFKPGSTPKTQPGRFASMTGSPGTEWRSAQVVTHPGIEERNPQKHVAEQIQPTVVAAIHTEISKAVGVNG